MGSHRLDAGDLVWQIQRCEGVIPGSSVLLRSYGIGGGHGMKALSAYSGEGFVQSVEDVIGADDVA